MSMPVNQRRCRLETLEDRQLLAVATQLLDGGATLRLVGDAAAETVNISQNDADDTLTIRWSSNGASAQSAAIPVQVFQSSAIKKIVVNLGAGNDSFTYQLNGDELLNQKTISVDLGAGNDSAFFDLGGSLLLPLFKYTGGNQYPIDYVQSSPAELRANVDITVVGGSGNDSIDAVFGNVRANLNYRVQGGAGNDTISGDIAGLVAQGFTALFDQDGGAGNDSIGASLQLEGVDTGGKLVVNQRGGDGQDSLSFQTFGGIQGILQVNQWGGNGNDVLTNTVLANWSSTGSVLARQYGEAGNDELHANLKRADIPNNIKLFAPLQPFTINALSHGGSGRNTAWLTPNVRSFFSQIKLRSWDAGFPIAVDPWPY